MVKKLVSILIASAILAGGVSATAFAATGELSGVRDSFKTVKQELKENIGTLKSKHGVVRAAMEAKISEAGFKKINKEDIASELQSIETLKGEIKELRNQLSAAKKSGDKDKISKLEAQLSDKAAAIKESMKKLAPYKEQFKENKAAREGLKPLKDLLKPMWEQGKDINEEDKNLKEEIMSLKSEIKAAVEAKDLEKVAALRKTLLEKLNSLNSNIEEIVNLKDRAVETITQWNQ